ncbi:hypothetical protein EMIT0P43_120016 [Pseudomonas jessenii]
MKKGQALKAPALKYKKQKQYHSKPVKKLSEYTPCNSVNKQTTKPPTRLSLLFQAQRKQ